MLPQTVILSNLNRFSKFFHRWKENSPLNKHISYKFPHHTLKLLPHYLVKRENCNLSKIAKKMPKNECKNHWIFVAHNFFPTFSKCRLTYGLILPVFCGHSSLLIPWLQCLEKRSVRMSWPHKTGLFDCSMPKSWCKSVRTTKWTSLVVTVMWRHQRNDL